MVTRGFYRLFTCAWLAGLVGGCASPPPLDDAQLGEITLASSEDQARFLEARMQYERDTFGGVTFNSRVPNQEPITFGPEDYDQYLAYLKSHRGTGLIPAHQIQLGPKWYDWPIVRLTFRSEHRLFDQSDLSPSVDFYLCDKKAEDWELIGIWYPKIMWQNKIVYPPVSNEITKTLKSGSPPPGIRGFLCVLILGLQKRQYWKGPTHAAAPSQ